MTSTNRRHSVRAPLLAAAIAIAFAAPFAHTDNVSAAGSDKRPAAQADTDRFIVKFKSGSAEHGNAAARQRKLDAIGREHGLRLGQVRRMALGADVLKSDKQLTPQQAKVLVGRLRADPSVEYAEVDARMQAHFSPNDTFYASHQWHYWEAAGGIRAPAAWDIATGAGQVVAVVDTGIRPHSDLDANILPGYDMIVDTAVSVDGDGRDADPTDPGDHFVTGQCGSTPTRNSSWHGTHVAGTIAAITNNATGVAGVAFDAKVVPVRVLGRCGGYVSDISDGIIWASGGTVGALPVNANPANVINLSLGGSGACGATYQAAINTAITNGSLVVVSAGNSNAPAANYRPSNCVGVVTVAATGRTGGRASYSNYGAAVEIAAPGGDGSEGVASTLNAGTTVPGAESYAEYNGTSMAAPHVAAVAALAREASGNSLAPAEITALLQATARSLPLPCVQGCGAGLLDAHAAVVAATSPILTVYSPTAANEGNSGSAVKTFTVKLSEAVASDVTFDYATVDGTASAGSDYVAASGSGVIPAGNLSTTFAVTINGDTDVEADESFTVDVDNVSGPVTVISDTGNYTIYNDETTVLANTVPVSATDTVTSNNRYFTLDVPANATSLKFTTAGGSGDADMYVRFNAAPTESTWTCRPYLLGNNETCNMTVQAGTWHVMLDAYEPYSNVTVTGSYAVPVDVTIGDASVSEGDAGTKLVTFTVTLSQLTGAATTYDVATAGDTATSDDDFVGATAAGQSIPAGTLSKTFSVTVNGDTAIEQDESFFVNLSNAGAGATITDGQGIGTISNDDYPSLSIDDQSSNEGDSGTSQHTFTVSLSQAATNDVTFDIATSGGSATSDDDFAANSATAVTIAEGDTSATFSVDVNGDTSVESDETYAVDVSNVVGATVGDVSGIGTISNDDFPTLTIDDATAVAEGDSGTKVLTFTATLSQAAPFPVSFDIDTADGSATAGSDYVAGSADGETIPAGQTSRTFSVTVNGDTDIENDETVLVDISNATGATITDSQASGTISNDDYPSLSIDDQSSIEGDSGTTQHTFTVSLSQAATNDVTFDIATTGGSATADDDFASNSATGVTITAGDTTATFSVDVNGDTAIEGNEAYTVDVANVVGATVADGSGTGTISNDDYPTLSIGDASVTEGNAGTKVMTFTASLSQASPFPATFNVATANGTAAAGSDYVGKSVVGATIPAGQTALAFSVTINGDGAMEGDETLRANLGNASGATIADGQGTGTIVNDDGTIFVDDVAVTEGNSGTKLMSFVVKLSQASTAPVTYNIKTHALQSTATAGVDYVERKLVGEVMPAGQTSRVFAVTINGDATLEPNETIRVLLGSGVVVSDGMAFGTILNDDGVGTLSISDAAFQEGDSGTKSLNFTVTLSAATSFPVTFNIFTVDGMAVGGSDFTARNVIETIPAGTLTKTFTVTTYGDTTIEGNETLFVRIANANVAVTDGQGRGVLINDDGPVLSISDATIVEGDSGNKVMLFTVSLTKLATAKVTFNFSTQPVTASGGSDFDPVTLTGVTIPYGQLSKMVGVIIRGDTDVEPDETLRGNISLGNVSIVDGVGVGTIQNDDAAP